MRHRLALPLLFLLAASPARSVDISNETSGAIEVTVYDDLILKRTLEPGASVAITAPSIVAIAGDTKCKCTRVPLFLGDTAGALGTSSRTTASVTNDSEADQEVSVYALEDGRRRTIQSGDWLADMCQQCLIVVGDDCVNMEGSDEVLVLLPDGGFGYGHIDYVDEP